MPRQHGYIDLAVNLYFFLLTFAESLIDQFQYIKIQPKTIDLSTRLWGITAGLLG